MTSGTAVLHHEAPPALPSPLQYPHHLLALLTLLIADILLTVWITSLGMPEMNPHIAPIAGSVAAQVAYKAPFALTLLGGTALLAAACDRLIPGAGKYPWLAVAGIYAVPVAWNLVVIAGHTGFHVVPAVVYAPVAVVCAVGVWRAALPRLEALTMPANHPNPRPAGPPSTSPPIASPRPGGASVPGRGSVPWLLVALAVLLIVSAAPAVSAEMLEQTVSGANEYTFGHNVAGDSYLASMSFYNIQNYQGLQMLFYRASAIPAQSKTILTSNPYYECGITLQAGDTTVGEGTAYYNSLWTNDTVTGYQCWIEFDWFDPGGKTGTTRVNIIPDSGYLWNKVTPYVENHLNSANSTYPLVLGTKDWYHSAAGYYSYIQNTVWYNEINPTEKYVYLNRSIGGTVYLSYLKITDKTGIIGDSSYGDTKIPVFPPYTWTVETPYGKTFSGSVGTSDSPPTSTPVTVYVQNSQTGALLANAHLSILAAAGGTETEVVNATLPGGTGTYSLEKADYLKYHASATADGYTLLSPILFGVPENGTTIVLWMAPDAPLDVPTEPEKSMLYGYVQTQGSQQPISGATVSLDGYGSTTTSSTGFYLFNNVTPGAYTISASAPLHDALSEPVTVDPAATPHNLALKGHFLLTVSAKDADDLTTLHNTTISLSDGQESTQNPATFTVDYGPYTITAAAGGYYPQTQSAYLDRPGTTTATVLLTERPPPATPAEMPNYPQHNVRFLCVDEYNHPLQNVTITAVYQESSGPVSWITDWLGLSQNVHVANSTLQGTTGLDGSVIFLMVQSVQYRMTVAAPDLNMTKTFDLYPKEDQITIRFVTSPGPDLSTMPAYDLTATETDPSSVRLALTYNDTTNATTHLSFQVYDHATGELIHSQNFAASSFPGTVSPTYTVENTKGAMYRFGFEATNTAHGTISQYTGITLKGDNLLVDLGFEDRTLYQWLAVILLFLFAGAFSGTTVKQGAILVPLFGGGLFWFIGWLPITIGGAISAIGFLGVLVYMRKSEWKVRA